MPSMDTTLSAAALAIFFVVLIIFVVPKWRIKKALSNIDGPKPDSFLAGEWIVIHAKTDEIMVF